MIDQIIRYENGELDDNGTLELFSELIKSGQCWSLQGHYGRTAKHLIDNGFINLEGEIDWCIYKEVLDSM
jgi:hypothetical protein